MGCGQSGSAQKAYVMQPDLQEDDDCDSIDDDFSWGRESDGEVIPEPSPTLNKVRHLKLHIKGKLKLLRSPREEVPVPRKSSKIERSVNKWMAGLTDEQRRLSTPRRGSVIPHSDVFQTFDENEDLPEAPDARGEATRLTDKKRLGKHQRLLEQSKSSSFVLPSKKHSLASPHSSPRENVNPEGHSSDDDLADEAPNAVEALHMTKAKPSMQNRRLQTLVNTSL